MKNNISVNIKAALKNDITVMEWCLLECIHFSSNNETGYCYASKERLRNHIGVSNGQIYKMIDKLENRGLIKKHKDTGHLKTTDLWVKVERGECLQKMENDSPKSGDDTLQKMETPTIKGEDEGRVEDKKTSKKEVAHTPPAIETVDADVVEDSGTIGDIAFEKFWMHYPNKKAKGKARVAFRNALKRADYNQIMQALSSHKRSKSWTKDGGQFIPHPATWLNGDRWLDEMTAADASSDDMIDAIMNDPRYKEM